MEWHADRYDHPPSQYVLPFYLKMHNSIEPIKSVIQTAGIILKTIIFIAKRIVFFQFPGNYNLYHIFYHSFGLHADYLLWWSRSARPKNVNWKATCCEGCQACLNETNLEIVVDEGVEAGHWSRHHTDIPVNGFPTQRIPYPAAGINALSQPQHLWLTQI